METTLDGCKIVLLDFFQKNKSKLLKALKSDEVQTFLEPLSDMTIIFSDIQKITELKKYLKTLEIPEDDLKDILQFFDRPFQSSFSWGFQDKEFVFIRLEETTKLFLKKNRKGLTGLIIHEVLHGVQRQRGLEIRLHDSLDFSLDFFTQLAEIIPPEKYNRTQIMSFLKQISQLALFALKDIFVNVELIKRGMAEWLIIFYRDELGFGEDLEIKPPQYETEFEKGVVKVKDLDSFATAFTYTLSLIPIWLPFMVLETDSKDYKPSRELKHLIFDKYYVNPSFITREMWHIENIFLASFSFSKSFHRKWYGAIFNLALEHLLGEDFLFYHLFKATELLEELYTTQESEERKSMAMVPILKAAYVYRREQLVGIQKRNIEELNSKMQQYEIGEEEIIELEESIDDSSEHTTSPEHMFENLMKLSIMIVTRDLRVNVFSGENFKFKIFSRTILSLLQAINYLEDECDDQYYHTVRLGVKRLLRTDNLFKRKRWALLLENFAQNTIFQGETEPSQLEIDELIYNYDFFEIPLTNLFINLGVSFIQNIKTVMKTVPVNDDEFPFLTAQLINIQIGGIELPIEDEEHLNLMYVSSLIATKGIPYRMIQIMLTAFLQTRVPKEETD
ncbi:hypothetical protein CEE45_11080 [Candidatus Heimdallarchaeota archaeon B3_Heim]|nr:MAG: hypothetical protein CEE45_11080 [Candidatus Heimdallarchaeota archaeon B3_Heim]